MNALKGKLSKKRYIKGIKKANQGSNLFLMLMKSQIYLILILIALKEIIYLNKIFTTINLI